MSKLEGKIAVPAAWARQSPSVWPRTERNVAITYTKGADAAASVAKEIERATVSFAPMMYDASGPATDGGTNA